MYEAQTDAQSRRLYEVLSDGEFHPVISGLKIFHREPTTFWISPVPVDISYDFHNHGEASDTASEDVDGYRVDFTSEKWVREGDDLSAIGQTALIDSPHSIRLLSLDGRGYVRLEPAKPRL